MTTPAPEFVEQVYAKLYDEDNPTPFGHIAIEASPEQLKLALYELRSQGRAEVIYGRGWHRIEQGVEVTMVIDNVYELYGTIQTTVTVTVPKPPAAEGTEDYDEWAYDHLYCETGTGREDGDSAYFAEITASSDPALVGRKFEWGV